jgi:hypothetical protein
MTQEEKRNIVLKQFYGTDGKKKAIIKDRLFALGILQSMNLEYNDVKHIISIFIQTDILNESQDRYEVSKNGDFIYRTGGYTPNIMHQLRRWLIKDGNYWKLINPIIGFLIGYIVKK